ncbi:hypothetical protein AC249_AIPGENE6041 [Exaiptasia diaphana]|nr:hypothetical protein AC249_AIPGENE6041 [Exaiptasia diaphana]
MSYERELSSCNTVVIKNQSGKLFNSVYSRNTKVRVSLPLKIHSDAGARPPESCIFGQFLNLAAVLGMTTFP